MRAARPIAMTAAVTMIVAALCGCEPGTGSDDGTESKAESETTSIDRDQVKAYVEGLDADARRALLSELGASAEAPEPESQTEDEPAALPERTDVIERSGAPLTVVGPELNVGDEIPAFELVSMKMEPVTSESLVGEPFVVSVVPSLDTPVCEQQTGTILARHGELPEGTKILTVSRDLPFAQRRFVEHKQESMEIPETSIIASDFREASFGRDWGLLVKENGLLARSVWVVDEEGKVAYRQIVKDQGTQPDYDALIAAAKETGSASGEGDAE